MKRVLLALLFVPLFAFAEESVAQTAETKNAVVVSKLIVAPGSEPVITYYNETTEQVCTYAESANNTAPALTCVFLHDLNDTAQEKVRALAALRFN